MRIDDRILAVLGRLVASMAGWAPWAPRVASIGLATLTLILLLIVGATPEPSDISYEDLQAGRIPAMTSWLRLEGDLTIVPANASYTFTDQWVYALRDTRGSGLAVTVVADSPLVIGDTQITGRISGVLSAPGTFASIAADVPTKPGRTDPWLLYGLPAVIAIGIGVGMRAGYPVVRRESPAASRPVPFESGGSVAVRLGGRIGGRVIPLDSMRSCTLAVVGDVETCDLILAERDLTMRITARRAAMTRRLRICRTSGCEPALEIHAPSGDLVLAFTNRVDRERIATALEWDRP
jgi:hypothetical protein